MTPEEAIEMLTAKAECIRSEASGTDIDCNLRNCDECDLCYKQGTMGDQMEALGVAISALQAQDSETIKICDTCKHDPPSKKWPCVDCDMREPADRWESARTFVELVVEYPDPELCTYKEYKGKPYYSIKYIENGETHVGYGTYNPEVLSQYLKEYFISSVQQEPLSDAYMKSVWTWLLDYQIKAAELKGRYTPYEVLSWVANDWRKEHDNSQF